MMDLSKALDCLHRELLIAKLQAYGFNRTDLKHIHSYLTERQQRVEINGSFSTLKRSYNNNNNSNTIYLQLAEEIAKANKGQLYTTFTIFSKNN